MMNAAAHSIAGSNRSHFVVDDRFDTQPIDHQFKSGAQLTTVNSK